MQRMLRNLGREKKLVGKSYSSQIFTEVFDSIMHAMYKQKMFYLFLKAAKFEKGLFL